MGHVVAAWRRIGQGFVIARYSGAQTLADHGKVAVFAHYDRDGCVDDFVMHYLRALARAGYAVVFVSNAPRLAGPALDRVLALSALVLHRRNVGYDFGAYKDGLAALGELTRFAQVVLANDSVYGPLFDLDKTLGRCDDRADVWGITDSREGCYHLQSYFLLFRHRALANPRLAAFWGSIRPVQSRQWIIRRYEIGLTQAMLRAGLRCAALCPHDAVVAAFGAAERADAPSRHLDPTTPHLLAPHTAIGRDRPPNIMHWFWDHLITDMRCPFIKRELLMENPLRVPNVAHWQDVVRRASAYDTDLIVRHLRTQQQGRSHRRELLPTLPALRQRNDVSGLAP